MSDWKSVVRTVAPALATALGGPLSGAVVSTISTALLGKPDSSMDEVAQAVISASPDTLLKLKQADAEFKTKMAALGVDLEKIAADDRASARQTLVQTRSWMPATISVLVIVATLSLYTHLLLHGTNGAPELVVGRILGTLDVSFGIVISFWLGTSSSSRSKDETIKTMAG